MATIKVKVKPGGKVEIKVEGAPGKACSDVTKALEKALGVTVKDQKTSEFYQQPVTQNQYNTQK